mmetsp:Transcript_41100/g.87737  ORF Transcript_41100/g.87737 Transcript_41100/m.87737 type:complete len:232 (+) Transcript_41100:126-821(+)
MGNTACIPYHSVMCCLCWWPHCLLPSWLHASPSSYGVCQRHRPFTPSARRGLGIRCTPCRCVRHTLCASRVCTLRRSGGSGLARRSVPAEITAKEPIQALVIRLEEVAHLLLESRGDVVLRDTMYSVHAHVVRILVTVTHLDVAFPHLVVARARVSLLIFVFEEDALLFLVQDIHDALLASHAELGLGANVHIRQPEELERLVHLLLRLAGEIVRVDHKQLLLRKDVGPTL